MVKILGIVNLTRDSFSDGGRYIDAKAATEQARRLVADGADVIDLGAESTHPDSEDVSSEEEIARLTPVIESLNSEQIAISVDTHKPAVMRHVLAMGVDYINDVTALRDPAAVEAVRDSDADLILMHSRSPAARAERSDCGTRSADHPDGDDPQRIISDILAFFEQRCDELAAAGIARDRLILDPGMGFFLGSNPEASLAVLRDLECLRILGLPLLVSTSRKSFVGAVLGEADVLGKANVPGESKATGGVRPVEQRAAGTLTTELWSLLNGADYIRTHDVRQLRDAERIWRAIERR